MTLIELSRSRELTINLYTRLTQMEANITAFSELFAYDVKWMQWETKDPSGHHQQILEPVSLIWCRICNHGLGASQAQRSHLCQSQQVAEGAQPIVVELVTASNPYKCMCEQVRWPDGPSEFLSRYDDNSGRGGSNAWRTSPGAQRKCVISPTGAQY